MKIRAPWMNTVFYITYKTEINTNSKINTTHEHLLTEIASKSSKQDRRFLFYSKMAHKGPTIHTKITHEDRRDENATLNDVIIGKNYVKQ